MIIVMTAGYAINQVSPACYQKVTGEKRLSEIVVVF